MDVWSLTSAALRRWYVLLPALLVTGLLTLSAGRSIAPEYETSGAVLLIPPSTVTGPNNPYAASSGPEALGIIISGSEVRARLAASGLEPSYEVTVARRSPIFTVKVRSNERERTLETGAAVIDALKQELVRGQREFGVPQVAMVTVKVLDAPDTLGVISSGATRVKAVVGLLGVIVSVGLAVTSDDVVLLFRRRRQPPGGPGPAQRTNSHARARPRGESPPLRASA